MECYPIVLFAYNRPDHLQTTLQMIENNCLAHDSILYVFVDGAKPEASAEEIERIAKVRSIVRSIHICKDVYVIISERNLGCRDSIIHGVSYVLQRHDALIVIEDDILISPAFLQYMNSALCYYKKEQSVFSISGYSHCPQNFQIPSDYEYGVYCSPRLFNWGWGTWRDRWEKVDWSMSYYEEFMKHSAQREAFSRGGQELIPMLTQEYEGNSSAWDIQFAFAHFANHAVSIVPTISYTHNIGLDGSGTHCGKHQEGHFDVSRLNQNPNPKLLDVLYFDKRILNAQYSIFSKKKRPVWQKAINFIARKLGRPAPFTIKDKIYC